MKWFIIPRLSGFRARFPGVELRVESSTHLVDFTRGEFDAALRVGAQHAPGTRTRVFGSFVGTTVCSPERARGVTCLQDVLDQPLIEMRQFQHRGWRALSDRIAPEQMLTFDTYLECMRAAEQGLGFAWALFPLTTEWVLSDRLSVPLAHRTPLPEGLQWVCRDGDKRPLLDAIGDWLADQFAALPRLAP